MPPYRATYARPEPNPDPVWEGRAATEQDCHFLNPRLTAASIAEIEAMSKYRPISALLQDLPNKRVISDNRRPLQPDAILYVLPMKDDPTVAGFWCSITDRLANSEHLLSFTSYFRGVVGHLNSIYPTLHSVVDARNITGKQLVEGLGFTLAHSIPPYCPKGIPFHSYSRSTAPCATPSLSLQHH